MGFNKTTVAETTTVANEVFELQNQLRFKAFSLALMRPAIRFKPSSLVN